MNEEKMREIVQEVLSKNLPDIVNNKVESKVDEKLQEVNENINNLQKEVDDTKSEAFNIQKAETKDGSIDGQKVQKTAEFFKALNKGDKEKLNELSKAANESTDSAGGYLVPDEFRNEVLYVIKDYGVGRRYADEVPMITDTMNMAQITSSVSVGFVGENSAFSTTDPTYGQKVLNASKIGAMTEITEELISDDRSNQDIFQRLRNLFGEEIARFEDNQILTGDGTGSNFEGALNNATKVYLGGNSTSGNTSFTNITYDDLVALVHSVDTKYKKGTPRFYMSQYIKELIAKIKDSNNRPIAETEGILRETNPTLFGMPVEVTDQMPQSGDDAADTKFLLFGDLRHYALGDRESMTATIGTPQTGFENDLRAIKVRERLDGKPKFDAAFKALASSAS